MSEVIVRLSALLKKREISSVELTKKYISAIEESNPVLNAYVSFNFETALKQAEIADKMLGRGERVPPLRNPHEPERQHKHERRFDYLRLENFTRL